MDTKPLTSTELDRLAKVDGRNFPASAKDMRRLIAQARRVGELEATANRLREALEKIEDQINTIRVAAWGDLTHVESIVVNISGIVRTALATSAPATPDRHTIPESESWKCPRCERWQMHKANVCRSEFDTGIPCDGRRGEATDAPAPQAPAMNDTTRLREALMMARPYVDDERSWMKSEGFDKSLIDQAADVVAMIDAALASPSSHALPWRKVAEGMPNPTQQQIVDSLAAEIFVLSPNGLAQLHAMIDEVSEAVGEKSFAGAKQRLSNVLSRLPLSPPADAGERGEGL